ncbi:ankyrin repeat domain-containing protein [Motiliproteus sediminis]|uniref:ankyrin repeat domain-containing protein n=1 Tax=Motiliproteus sediminis TaxID=1468178 RepID=UPI001AEF9988|nr:ankyrin repeat domain-containing protein [Motiliproteus sediminis]
MHLRTLPVLILIGGLATPAFALTPCRIEGKVIYTRECIQRQQGEISDELHNQQQRAIATTAAAPTTESHAAPIDPVASTVSTRSCPTKTLLKAVANDNSAPLLSCGDPKQLFEIATESGRTLMHQAAFHGSEQSLAYLLSKRAPLEAKSSSDHGATPLHLAAERNQQQLVLMLHRAGANLEARDYLKRTALHRASRAGSLQALRTLIRLRADVHAVDRTLQTPLLSASRYPGSAEILNALLDAGADVNRRARDEMTALHYAITTDTQNTVALVNHGIDLDARDSQGRTALLLAALADIDAHWPRIKRVVEAGANLNAKDKNGNTLLKIAYHQQHEQLLKLLLRHGVDSRNVTTIIRNYESRNDKTL